MTASRVPTLIDGLVAVYATALALAGFDEFGLAAPVQVNDGPIPAQQLPAEVVIVGDNADDDDDAPSAFSDRGWAGLGAKKRDETGEIQCAVITQTGDGTFKAIRDRAFALLELLEVALTADPTVGGATGTPGWAYITAGPLRETLTPQGAVVRIPFTVSYRARIA